MNAPRLHTMRTVRCPCGGHKVQGTQAELLNMIRHGLGENVCPTCGRRFIERPVNWRGAAQFVFVRAHEAPR